MGTLHKPQPFNMKDLYLSVNLRSCIDGKQYDFTGKKTFDTSFYRDNVGFGITDIQIEVNPSLQPSIEITFKDLYGNTLFGNQRGDDNALDMSVLFNWPPPKFIFTFKGYLGSEVTWLLNLKASNVTYVPSDGSYEIKCSFVPNQWGFLADIPVLYLLACKKLRYDEEGKDQREVVSVIKDEQGNELYTEKCTFKTDSIFSYTRVGKQIESKTTEETKQFELLSKQLTSMRYGLSNAMFTSKIINAGEPVMGVVNNIPIKNFTNLKVNNIDLAEYDKLKSNSLDSKNIRQLDTYLQLKIEQGVKNNPGDEMKTSTKITSISPGYDEINGLGSATKAGVDLTIEKTKVFTIIDENLKLIDDEIKRRIYSSTKKEIGKLTIGEVFQQIARDSGYILGKILQAGFEGYARNKDKRDGARTRDKGADLIGNCFPLCVNKEGKEVPALQINNSTHTNYGVEENEMKFVDNFIGAIGEGIAENLISDEITTVDDKVKNRINNLEAIQENPYKPFYVNIAENILIRSGIIAYVTRGSDPTMPGNYGSSSFKKLYKDFDSKESIITLVKNDIENLTKDILTQLSFTDKASLIKFCKFFDGLISDDGDNDGHGGTVNIGEYFLRPYEKTANPNFELSSKLKPYLLPVPDDILKYEIIVDDFTTPSLKHDYEIYSQKGTNLETIDINLVKTFLKLMLFNEKTVGKLDFDTMSLKTVFESIGITTERKINTGIMVTDAMADLSTPLNQENFYNVSQISPAKLTAYNVKNNNVYYSIPYGLDNEPYFILYTNPADVSAISSIPPPTDATSDEDLISGENEPIGVVKISAPTDEDGNTLEIIKRINTAIDEHRVLNYSKCKGFKNAVSDYLQTQKIQELKELRDGELAANGLAYTVYTKSHDSLVDGEFTNYLVFAPFCDDSNPSDPLDSSGRSLNQRIAIKTMCKLILAKFSEIENEKNEIISNILGKASESRDLIYKQMHTIFQQWQVIASSLDGEFCSEYRPNEKENLAYRLEEEYGGCTSHYEKGDGVKKLKDVSIAGNTLFVYDYPLNPVKGGENTLLVKNSIINIEPLYKPNGNTTILNIIQQICTKNNFVFVPFPGDANSDNINEIYKAMDANPNEIKIRNYFHVLFVPTPETRSKLSNDSNEFATDFMRSATDFSNNAISIAFGSINNQIIKSINVGTDSTKPTAESILNLQRLVDKDNTNKKIGMDCSMLPVYEGRSYKTSVEMIGNAQVYPMQYFYIDNMQMFGGLYQIMKVSHSITPNNMTTKIEGIRMRFSTDNQYGGIPPFTTEDLKALGPMLEPLVGSDTSTGALANFSVVTSGNGTNNVGGSVLGAYASVGGTTSTNKGIPTSAGPKLIAYENSMTYDISMYPIQTGIKGDNSGPLYYINWRNNSNFKFAVNSASGIQQGSVAQNIIPMLLAMQSAGFTLISCYGARTYEKQVELWNDNGWTLRSTKVPSAIPDKIGKVWDTSWPPYTRFNYPDTVSYNVNPKATKAAFPGRSNHGFGLAFDINANELGINGSITNKPLYKWLIANAYKYGFTRTTSSEGWHWEFQPGKFAFSYINRCHESWLGIPDELAAEGYTEFANDKKC